MQEAGDIAVQGQRPSAAELILFEEGWSFVLLRSSTGWMRPTHIMESNLLYSKSTCLSSSQINFI